MPDFQLDQNAANLLATIMHKASLGDTGSTTGTTSAQQEGQSIIDQATTPSTPVGAPADQTTTAMPTPSNADWEKAKVNQGYGVNGHPGIDLGVPIGTPLTAAEAGTITAAGNTDPGGYGNEVEITAADGTVMRYGHLSSIGVKLGQQVAMGAPIGASGGAAGATGSGNSTGAHLHFEVRKGGHTVDPVPFLAGGGGVVDGSGTTNPAAQSVNPVDPEATAGANILAKAAGQPLHDAATPATPDQQGQTASTGGTGDTDPGAIDSFLAAIRQKESGGNYRIRNTSGQSNAAGAYQFIGTTWRGLGGSTGSAADASPAEQDAIARAYATQLFNQYHSWRLAAIAWYQPSAADAVARGQDPGAPAGQGRFIDYGNSIAQMMAGGIGNTDKTTATPGTMPGNLAAGTNQEGARQTSQPKQGNPATNPLVPPIRQGEAALHPPKQQAGLSSLSVNQRARFDQLQKTHKGKRIAIRAESGKIVFVLPNGRKVSAGSV